MALTATARAKVNLYLHVAAPDARGYHPLQSLVVFADIGDEVTLSPAQGCQLSIEGPFSQGLSAGEDNLIMKAVRRFEALASIRVHHDILLTKNLPSASGIGGGSADAGAVLTLLRQAYASDMGDDDLAALAGAIGADGVMCLWSQPAVAEGYGEKLTSIDLPSVPAVLINPRVECSTAVVYAGFDAQGKFNDLEASHGFSSIVNIDDMVTALSHTRNDLQAPAIRMQPVIAQVLTDLESQPETLFARMSGSGASCFALCRTDEDAEALSVRLRVMYPAGWVRRCRLG
jgi:4-diphosphocytidyl-2-C-methyl-D-erythritol kinase